MNFFAHALLARSHRTEPAFAVGAMLPDWMAMSGVRRADPRTPELTQGVAFHHLTDALFHRSAVFIGLERSAYADLSRLGLARGGALAVAHVGTEILIDVVLGRRPHAARAYCDALDWALSPAAQDGLEWLAPGDAERFERMLAVLADRGLSVVDSDASLITRRLRRILEQRPLLALRASDEELVELWITRGLIGVEGTIDALLWELTSAFAARGLELSLGRPLGPHG